MEQHGAGEAYLPVLEALGRIGRAPGGEQFVATRHQYAPTWLVQMPALLAAEELETVQRRVVGATRERMLREMVEAIEALAAQRPLVLWFEDLHWADTSTVDWLAAVAQQGAPARLLVIGTYRPSDLSLSGHPLRAVKQELAAKGQSEERLHTTVDKVGYGVPASLRQLIEKHLERLSEEHQRVLAVASVAGVTFSTAAVATGIELPVEQVEEVCEGLVQRGQFLQAQEPQVLSDGTLCGSYGFQHALQQAVVYERIPSLRRVRLHRRVGEAEERLYGTRAHEIAAELAVHFERSQEYDKAAHYHHQAGLVALRRQANREAIAHFTQGIALLTPLPEIPDRLQQELTLQVALGSPLQALHGYSAPEVEAVYTRAQELGRRIDATAQLFPVLRGLYVFYLLRGKIQTAHELAERLLSIAHSTHDSALLLEAHFAVGQTLMFRGELVAAREHLEHGITLYDPVRHHSHASLYGQDPGVFCRLLAAWTLGWLGYPDQALQQNQQALALAQEVVHPLSLAATQAFFALTHQFRREAQAAQEHAEAAVALCARHGFPFFLAFGTILRGWALTEQGQMEQGIAQIRQGLTAYRATGAECAMVRFMALLAEAWGKAGQPEQGRTMLTEALAVVHNNGERDYEAELYRLQGEMTLAGARGWGLGTSSPALQAPSPKPQREWSERRRNVFTKLSPSRGSNRPRRWSYER